MAIRDRFRRALRKSESSDTISQTDSNTTTATTSETSSLHKSTSSRLARTFPLSRRSKDDSNQESKRDKNRKIHPSQRPLTLQNLKHQEMLSRFSMTFGASDPNQIESASFMGVSPCCTRAPSLDINRTETNPSLMDSPDPGLLQD